MSIISHRNPICNLFFPHGSLPAVHYHMMRAGLGAVLTTDSVATSVPEGQSEILHFVPKHPNFRRTLSVVYKKGVPLTHIAGQFITQTQDICRT